MHQFTDVHTWRQRHTQVREGSRDVAVEVMPAIVEIGPRSLVDKILGAAVVSEDETMLPIDAMYLIAYLDVG